MGLNRAPINAAVTPTKPHARVIRVLLGSQFRPAKLRVWPMGCPKDLPNAATEQVTGVRGVVGLVLSPLPGGRGHTNGEGVQKTDEK